MKAYEIELTFHPSVWEVDQAEKVFTEYLRQHAEEIQYPEGMLKATKTTAIADNAALNEMKLRIAYEKNIPPELASRLAGTNETEIYKDAATMLGIIRAIQGPAPLYVPSGETSVFGSGFAKTKHTPKQY